jgi:hypothetical protein
MEDAYPYVIIRNQGKIFRIERSPFETHERTMDRGWFIVDRNPQTAAELAQAEAESHRWANEKYCGMKYATA